MERDSGSFSKLKKMVVGDQEKIVDLGRGQKVSNHLDAWLQAHSKLKTPRLKDFTTFYFFKLIIFFFIETSYFEILDYHFQKQKQSILYISYFYPEETKIILKHKYNTAGKTIREMLYRFPISIYMIFSRMQHPQTLAALMYLRSFGNKKKQPCLSTGTF